MLATEDQIHAANGAGVKKLPVVLKAILDHNHGRILDLFNSVDMNGDGIVQQHELRAGFEELGIALSEEDLDHLFDAMDADDNGRVELHELRRLISKGELKDASEYGMYEQNLAKREARQAKKEARAAKERKRAEEDASERLAVMQSRTVQNARQTPASKLMAERGDRPVPRCLRDLSVPEARAVAATRALADEMAASATAARLELYLHQVLPLPPTRRPPVASQTQSSLSVGASRATLRSSPSGASSLNGPRSLLGSRSHASLARLTSGHAAETNGILYPLPRPSTPVNPLRPSGLTASRSTPALPSTPSALPSDFFPLAEVSPWKRQVDDHCERLASTLQALHAPSMRLHFSEGPASPLGLALQCTHHAQSTRWLAVWMVCSAMVTIQ